MGASGLVGLVNYREGYTVGQAKKCGGVAVVKGGHFGKTGDEDGIPGIEKAGCAVAPEADQADGAVAEMSPSVLELMGGLVE